MLMEWALKAVVEEFVKSASDHKIALDKATKAFTHKCTCGKPVRCEIELGKSECWCFNVQVKSTLAQGDKCLCRKCLTN